MKRHLAAVIAAVAVFPALAEDAPPPRNTAELLELTTPEDWRTPDPSNLLYLELPKGRVIIELAPDFAPKHAANIHTLVAGRFFDGLAVVRVHDGFVTQWGDPQAGEENARALGDASPSLPPEYFRTMIAGEQFTPMPGPDGWAPEAGFVQGFHAARDPATGQIWLPHCYGVVGAGRDLADDSGNGAELYAIIGHAPRTLDRNITVVGRVLDGIELLSGLPRGTGPLGFYETPEERTTISSVRFASDLPEAERTKIEVLRTDSDRFRQLIEIRRNRQDDFYHVPAGYLDLCAMNIPVRLPDEEAAQ